MPDRSSCLGGPTLLGIMYVIWSYLKPAMKVMAKAASNHLRAYAMSERARHEDGGPTAQQWQCAPQAPELGSISVCSDDVKTGVALDLRGPGPVHGELFQKLATI